MTRFTPLIESLPASVPFVGPEALERRSGHVITARIGANENGFGPAPSVVAAMKANAHAAWIYGDPEQHDLKQALAAHLGVGPENLAIGEGIDGLLALGLRLILEPGDKVATSLGAYPTFNFHVASLGGELVTTPYVNDREDPKTLLALAKAHKAKALYFANPDNPMGTVWPAADVQNFIDAVPENCILFLDEAYTEFASEETRPAIDVTRRNLLRFRTFSKAYGLAGMRVGYAIGHADVIKAFDKIRNHFAIGRLAQISALAALKDQTWLAQCIAQVNEAKAQIYEITKRHGLAPIASSTNFVSIDCVRDGAFAKSIVDYMLTQGIFIRMPGVAPLNRCIRVSCGPREQLDLFDQALGRFLALL